MDIGGGRVLVVGSEARQCAYEPLFSGDDDDGMTLPRAIEDAVRASPVDARRDLLGTVLLCGGLGRALGLGARLQAEVCGAGVVRARTDPQALAWAGAALLAATPAIDAIQVTGTHDQAKVMPWGGW